MQEQESSNLSQIQCKMSAKKSVKRICCWQYHLKGDFGNFRKSIFKQERIIFKQIFVFDLNLLNVPNKPFSK